MLGISLQEITTPLICAHLVLKLPSEVKIREAMICNVSSEVPSGEHKFQNDTITESGIIFSTEP